MMDVIYTPQEMDFPVEAAEHFREKGRLYTGSYFELIDRTTFVPCCIGFLEAYRRALDTDLPEPPTQEPGWVRIRKVGAGFRLQADEAHVDLTCVAVREFRHDTTEQERLTLITTVIAKSWPKDSNSDEAQLDPQD
jgi:hypothetical protein